eukprot:scaffold561_cov254-Pinguiococcus_pyrenoidosus.AAC.5
MVASSRPKSDRACPALFAPYAKQHASSPSLEAEEPGPVGREDVAPPEGLGCGCDGVGIGLREDLRVHQHDAISAEVQHAIGTSPGRRNPNSHQDIRLDLHLAESALDGAQRVVSVGNLRRRQLR